MASFDGVRVAARTLRKQPGFAIVVILSLALAISLNTTMYSVLDAMIHPRVDIRDPAGVFSVRFFGDYRSKVTNPQRDSLLVSSTHVIVGTAWYDAVSAFRPVPVAIGDRLIEASVGAVSPEFFDMMGPRMIRGRAFVSGDRDAVPQPILLNESVLQKLFPVGADPLGATITVHDSSYRVIGVLSRYSEYHDVHADGWILGNPSLTGGYSRIIRVKPGTTRRVLEQDLDMIARRIAAAANEDPASVAFRVAGATRDEVRINSLHRGLIFAVIALLLVACANVANMQLARGIGRRRELALRTALGATRRRIIAHLLIESALLGIAGLVLGLVLTYWGMAALKGSIPPAIGEFVVEATLSWRVLVFALLAMLVCITLVGLAPAIRISAVDPNEMLKSAAGTGATRRNRRQYGYLVVVEIALALALLSGSAAMIVSAIGESTAWYGYDPARLARGYTVARTPIGQRRATSDVLAELTQQVHGGGAINVAADMSGGGYEKDALMLADSNTVHEYPVPGYGFRIVTPNYFRTMGLPIIDGRDFVDGERDVPAVIVDEFTKRKLWPNASPVGALMKFGGARSTRPFVRIVGVVGQRDRDGSIKPLDMAVASGTIGMVYYLPGAGDSLVGQPKRLLPVTITGRTNGDASLLALAMRRGGMKRAKTMDELMDISRRKASIEFVAKLFTLFGALGLGLAAFGVYGVVAHSVAERRRELGVRIALGATSRNILHAVLRESVIIALSGMAAGLFVTKYGVRPLQTFGADIYDAPLFAAVAIFMTGVAATSAFIPALRATRVDPTESLRSE